jgi:hypothetical protein
MLEKGKRQKSSLLNQISFDGWRLGTLIQFKVGECGPWDVMLAVLPARIHPRKGE